MSKKHKGGQAPTPAGNQSRFGPEKRGPSPTPAPEGEPASEQDHKHRLGDYDAAGEHSIEQPDGKKGSDH
jgi:hypothetical protein